MTDYAHARYYSRVVDVDGEPVTYTAYATMTVDGVTTHAHLFAPAIIDLIDDETRFDSDRAWTCRFDLEPDLERWMTSGVVMGRGVA